MYAVIVNQYKMVSYLHIICPPDGKKPVKVLCDKILSHLLCPKHNFPVLMNFQAGISIPCMKGSPWPLCFSQVGVKAPQINVM